MIMIFNAKKTSHIVSNDIICMTGETHATQEFNRLIIAIPEPII